MTVDERGVPLDAVVPGGAAGPGNEAAVDDELVSGIPIAVLRLARRLRAAQAVEAVTLSQLSVLASLAHRGPCSPSTLAEVERVQPPSMTRLLAALEERGLAVRTPHPTDRRQSLIDLTDAGRSQLEEARRRRQAWLARSLAKLSSADRDTLRAVLPVLERLGACD